MKIELTYLESLIVVLALDEYVSRRKETMRLEGKDFTEGHRSRLQQRIDDADKLSDKFVKTQNEGS